MTRKVRTKDIMIVLNRKKQQKTGRFRYGILFSITATAAAAIGTVLGPGIQPVLADAPDSVTEDLSENLRGG